MYSRIFDLFLILLISPFLIIIFTILYILILLIDGKPIIFAQKRCGLNCEEFYIYKFRTMKIIKDNLVMPDNERITKLGKFLRNTSLDEIPSVYNILIGDMAFVGPRPLISEYKKLYNDFQNRRHEIRPGITGYAQIKGRNRLKWNEKFVLDVYYVDNKNFFFDIKILILTFFRLFQTKDNQFDDETTMYKFSGKEED